MIFLDSSFLVAIEVKTDDNHERAVKIIGEILRGKYEQVFISDYVFDETITVTLVRAKDLKKAIFVGENLIASAKLIKVDENIFWNAWKRFKEQKRTRFSFTDCTILSIMAERNIAYIATFDKEFVNVPWIKVIG